MDLYLPHVQRYEIKVITCNSYAIHTQCVEESLRAIPAIEVGDSTIEVGRFHPIATTFATVFILPLVV